MEMSYKQPASKKIKARAPPPPMRSTSKSHMEHMTFSESEVTGNLNSEESKEILLHRKVALTICLPDGQEKSVTVDGSKAVMDFLVDLCSQHHLNPAQHTLEVRSGVSQQPLILRPNTLIGTLDVETIFLKEKVTEVKVRKPPPKIPEKTVRLVVNFLGTQKAVVRVNPAVPLRNILPAVCEKCELSHENVTLLRDAVSKEELDMSQSLNELGIKELYAWSSKQEKNRNLSSNSDTAEKEKKGMLGFFRSHKKGNKNKGNIDSDDYEEVFRTAPTSGSRYEGFSTAPSSPSVNSRPIALGASLSLTNISGIGARTEMKKRRAPPPPNRTAPIVTAEKTPEDMSADPLYATAQKDQQKKKRRAPPLPPTPQMPNEKYEELENMKSSTGEKRLIRCNSVSSEEVLTTDDAGSVNSYTEDSGIMSSPSDSISLDLQNYCSKKRDKAVNQANEYMSYDNMQPARTESFNSEDSWNRNTAFVRAEDEVALVKNGDEENFIAEQFQQTLAGLDEDSEDMDDGDFGDSSHTDTRSSPVGEESSHYNDFTEHSASVPVTVIDQVSEMNTLKYNTHNFTPVKEYNKIQQSFVGDNSHSIIVHPEVDKQKNKNSITYRIHHSLSQEAKSKYVENYYTSDISINDSSINTRQKQCIVKENLSSNVAIPAPFIKVSQETRPTKERTDIMPEEKEKIEIKDNRASNDIYKTTESTRPVLWRQQTYEPKVGMTTFTVVPPKPDIKKYDREVSLSDSAIKIDDLGNLISPQSSFDKSNVKDTFINDTEGPLVEKPLLERAKEFWRSNSMDSQVVETKEQTVKKLVPVRSYKPNQALENKVHSTPFVGLIPKMPVNKLNDINKQLLPTKSPISEASQEKMIIVENANKGRTEVSFLKPTVYSKFNEIQQKKTEKSSIESVTSIESTIKGISDLKSAVNDRPNGSQQTKPLPLSTTLQEKIIFIDQPIKEKKDLPFLKSSKRTSSQYVASAISRYVDPVNKGSIQISEAKLDANVFNKNTLKSNGNFIAEEPNVEVKAMNKQEVSVDLKKNFHNSNGQVIKTNLQMESTTKLNSDSKQFIAVQKEKSLSEQNGFNGSKTILGSTTITKGTSINSVPFESSYVSRPISGLPSNAFLKAVREKSVKMEQANSIVLIKSPVTTVVSPANEEKQNIDIIPSTVIDEPDSPSSCNVFGPKTRFRPVVQKPMQKDTSLHSALMGAIQSGEGKEKLRKIQSSPTDGIERKFSESENERSALLSAIRAHNGISRLKKVSSVASDELQTLRSKEMLQKDNEFVGAESVPSPPFSPPPPPPPVLHATPKSPPVSLNSSVDAREALLEAIRSGAGSSRLKKVSASMRTL